MCDRGEIASPSSKGVVVDAVMLLMLVTVAVGSPFCSSMRDQDGSDTPPFSSATPPVFPGSHVVGEPANVSATGGLDCSSVLDAELEVSRAW